MKGHVTRILADKKFGFIKADGATNGEFFFHRQDLIGHWDDLVTDFNKSDKSEQIRVEFIEGKTEKGPRARDVRRLDYPNQAV